MTRLTKLAIGAVLTLLLGLVGIHGVLTPYEGLARRAEARLGSAAEAALIRQGYSWARVEMRGQRAIVTGAAPSYFERDDALGLVRRAELEGGALIGGVTRVVDATTLLPVADPYRLTATRSDDGEPVRIAGAVRNDADLERVRDAARRSFAGGFNDEELGFAAGAPEGVDWGEAARLGVEALSRLREGEFVLENGAATVTGVAGSERARAAFEEALAGFPDTVTLHRVITLAEPPAARTPRAPDVAAEPGAAGETGPGPADAAEPREEITRGGVCQERFDLLMLENTINFETDLAEVRPESFGVLDLLADTAQQCARFRIQVDGHTDALGAPEWNEALSLARAEAVAAYLVARGVAPERLDARGLGATRPVATNDTSQGRAANRRIEFSIVE